MLKIHDVQDAIKNNPLIYVGRRPGVISLDYTKEDLYSSKNDIDTTLHFVDLIDKYNFYVIMEIPYSIEKEKLERFIILINDHNTLKDKKEDWILKMKKEVVEEYTSVRYDFIFDAPYTIIESPELFKTVKHWYELTNNDYSYARYITV